MVRAENEAEVPWRRLGGAIAGGSIISELGGARGRDGKKAQVAPRENGRVLESRPMGPRGGGEDAILQSIDDIEASVGWLGGLEGLLPAPQLSPGIGNKNSHGAPRAEPGARTASRLAGGNGQLLVREERAP